MLELRLMDTCPLTSSPEKYTLSGSSSTSSYRNITVEELMHCVMASLVLYILSVYVQNSVINRFLVNYLFNRVNNL